MIFKIPLLYLTRPKLPHYDTDKDWYNSWTLPEGDSTIVIFYAPQYLEFLGFLLILITFVTLANKFTSSIILSLR